MSKFPSSLRQKSPRYWGDVALGEDGNHTLHVHCVLGGLDGKAFAGHPLFGIVRPTLEVVLAESQAHLCKHHDLESGLPLIDVEDRL